MIDTSDYTLIKGTKPDLKGKHLDATVRSYDRYRTTKSRKDIMKAVYHGVNAAILHDADEDNVDDMFALLEITKGFISLLTPNELTQIFPVEKTYDGERWDSKDYFSVMEVLESHGMDTPVGDKVEEILWDYMNRKLMNFHVELFSVVSKLYKAETGIDPFEQFLRSQGITPLTMTTMPNGNQYLVDNDTGKMTKVSRPRPDGWDIVKA